MTIRLATVGLAAALVATALSSGQAQQAPATYMYTLMLNLVGPPANSLWQAVGAEALNDQDWERIKQMVTRLTESAVAVSAEGTSSEEVERSKSSEWRTWAGKLADSASAAAHAVDLKDQMALVTASDTLVEACEGCHMAFPPATQ